MDLLNAPLTDETREFHSTTNEQPDSEMKIGERSSKYLEEMLSCLFVCYSRFISRVFVHVQFMYSGVQANSYYH